MYKKYPKGEITLWCDGRGEEEDEDVGTKKGKKADGDKVTRRQEREDEIDDVVKQLKEKHKDLYTLPNYRLWARSVCGNLHDDLADLPSFPGHTAAKKLHENPFKMPLPELQLHLRKYSKMTELSNLQRNLLLKCPRLSYA